MQNSAGSGDDNVFVTIKPAFTINDEAVTVVIGRGPEQGHRGPIPDVAPGGPPGRGSQLNLPTGRRHIKRQVGGMGPAVHHRAEKVGRCAPLHDLFLEVGQLNTNAHIESLVGPNRPSACAGNPRRTAATFVCSTKLTLLYGASIGGRSS